MKNLFLFLLLFLLATTLVKSQCPLCVPKDGLYNVDSLYAIDTCLVPNSARCDTILRLDAQSKYMVGLYTKRYSVGFDYFNYIPLPSLPIDSLVLVTWQQIDTMFPATRAGFAALEARFGSFLFRKVNPHITDSLDNRARVFDLFFTKLQYSDSLTIYIRAISGVLDFNPIPNFIDNQTSVKEANESGLICVSKLLNNGGILSVNEPAQRLGWRLVNIVGQTVKEFAPESYNNTVTLNNLNSGIYFAIFPTCTSLIIFLGDTK
jgi:hypothetical protein